MIGGWIDKVVRGAGPLLMVEANSKLVYLAIGFSESTDHISLIFYNFEVRHIDGDSVAVSPAGAKAAQARLRIGDPGLGGSTQKDIAMAAFG